MINKEKIEEKITTETFKERVAKSAIEYATIYQERFVEYDYLVCSEAFVNNNSCHEIKANKNNYLHLLGVNTSLSADEFFNKCINNELCEEDFDFNKKGQIEASVKGSVRQKIKALPEMLNMFDKKLFAEQNFNKNKISCLFAAADSDFTIGFVETGRPKSLMRKNQLNKDSQKPVELVLRKKRSEQSYTEIIVGDEEILEKYRDSIKEYIK